MKKMKKIVFISTLFLLSINGIFAQDVDDLLDSELLQTKEFTSATFKSTHIINSHSVAQLKKNHLNFIIYHRFGAITDGINNFFGIDIANMRLGFEYGLNDWLTIGLGKTNFEKTYDGFIKARLFRQCKGGNFSSPVTLTYLVSTEIFTRSFNDPDRVNYFSSRITYVHQLLIARKFNENLSLQLMPTIVHKNLVKTVTERNDIPAIGIGGRFKITKRIALTFEYYKSFRLTNEKKQYHDPIGIGFDIETRGHVFQLIFTNSPLMQEGGFIYGAYNNDILKGDIHFGFNITRIFSFNK